ncbi:MAG: hypothetical protein E7407_00735 [Ruminococcaceae bacterium]|nr:hypothetical protein [Oscillospiraceae bacterium]
MGKVSLAVRKETFYIAVWVIVLSALLQACFIITASWDISVLLGNILSGGVSVLNFFLMGLTVQKAVEKDEKEARNTIKTSQSLRMLMIFAFAAAGAALPWFNTWSILIPLLFPRVAIAMRPFLDKKENTKGERGV